MPDADLSARLSALEQKIDALYVSAEKTRKYILWSIMAGAALFVLPLVFLPFAMNSLVSSYSSALNF